MRQHLYSVYTPRQYFSQQRGRRGVYGSPEIPSAETARCSVWTKWSEAGVSNCPASLGHTGRRGVVLGHTLNTQTLTKTDEQNTVLSKFTILRWATFIAILGHIWPWLWVGYPCRHFSGLLGTPPHPQTQHSVSPPPELKGSPCSTTTVLEMWLP